MKKVLCIEDDSFIADLYARVLRKAGFEVSVNPNGEEALREARENVYDIILLDLMLPDKSGVDILEALRGPRGTKMPLTKIIVATNFDEPEDDKAHLEKLADGYIIKADVTPNRLVEIIEDVLKEK